MCFWNDLIQQNLIRDMNVHRHDLQYEIHISKSWHVSSSLHRTLLSSIDISTYPSHGMSHHPYIGLCYPQLIYLHISDVFNYENMWKLHKYCVPFIVNPYFYYNITLFINDVVIINHATNILYDEVSRNRQLRQSKYLLRAWTYTSIAKLV
jgi:hypothetical protein